MAETGEPLLDRLDALKMHDTIRDAAGRSTSFRVDLIASYEDLRALVLQYREERDQEKEGRINAIGAVAELNEQVAALVEALKELGGLRSRRNRGRTMSDQEKCRSCGALVTWALQKSGKYMPIDPDGTSHFATCPQANQWRKR